MRVLSEEVCESVNDCHLCIMHFYFTPHHNSHTNDRHPMDTHSIVLSQTSFTYTHLHTHIYIHTFVGLYTALKVSCWYKADTSMVSKWQISETFNDTFYDDIKKHKSYLDPKVNFLKLNLFCFHLITSLWRLWA